MLASINRLTKKTDFENVRQNGKHESYSYFSISYFDRRDSKPSRFGFIVSKKISMKSHDRNRVKRILREITHKNLSEVKKGFDFVIVAKPSIMHATSVTIEASLLKCLKNF